MKRHGTCLAFAVLVCALCLVTTARAEEPPMAAGGYETQYPAAPYPAAPYPAAPYPAAPYPAAPYPPPAYVAPPYAMAPYAVAPYSLRPPGYDEGSPQYCARSKECGGGTLCSGGRCVPYHTEGYGGWVALGHLLGGPLGSSAAHFAHDEVGKGFTSLGVGTASFFIGGAMACSDNDGCTYGEFVAGALIGYIIFAVIDCAFIAKRKVPDARVIARPVVLTTAKSVTGGVGAQF